MHITSKFSIEPLKVQTNQGYPMTNGHERAIYGVDLTLTLSIDEPIRHILACKSQASLDLVGLQIRNISYEKTQLSIHDGVFQNGSSLASFKIQHANCENHSNYPMTDGPDMIHIWVS